MPDENQIVLLLDMADENQIFMSTLEAYIPESDTRQVYRLSEHGAVPGPRGSNRRQRRDWMVAVNKMLDQVRADMDPRGVEPHLYVAGRVSLPIWAYLGVRLSKWVCRITCINRRPMGEWDVLPLHGHQGEGAGAGANADDDTAYFNVVCGLDDAPAYDARGKVAVFVGVGHDTSDRVLEEFVSAEEGELAGIVRIQAMGTRQAPVPWFDADQIGPAWNQLIQLFVGVKNRYPDHQGLVLFLAVSGPLALLVGMAVNPHYFKPVWLPNYDGSRYHPAIEFPWGHGRTLKLFYAVANPVDQQRLNMRPELDAVRAEFDNNQSDREFSFEYVFDAEIEDIRRAMLEQRPQVLHISGHGAADATALVRAQDGRTQRVSADALVGLLETTNDAHLDLVVLNTCWSSDQAKALTRFVDCAIGMSHEIDDDWARDFSRTFYAALVRGRSVQNAYDQSVHFLEARYPVGNPRPRDLVRLHTRDGVDANDAGLVDQVR